MSPQVDRLSEIFEALDTDESGDAVHYTALFDDDEDDMNQGMTAETIRGQHLQERLEFMQVRLSSTSVLCSVAGLARELPSTSKPALNGSHHL